MNVNSDTTDRMLTPNVSIKSGSRSKTNPHRAPKHGPRLNKNKRQKNFSQGLTPQAKKINDPKIHAHRAKSLVVTKGKLRIIPLGGCEEVGRNMTVFEYENDIVIIDMGLQWPEEDMPGIDYIIPNTTYLKGKEKNIRGVIITHGHYDHIGAVPHLAPLLGNPVIYGTPLTLGIISKRQEDFKTSPLRLKSIQKDSILQLGKFRATFFGVSHNIPGSLGVILDTPAGKVVHTGDFKLDPKTSGDAPAEMEKIKNLGRQNVLALMADSTNATEIGHQLAEFDIQHNIDDILSQAPARVIVGTFSSLLGRIQQIIWSAEKLGKKIVIEGFSMKRNVELAQQLGYMTVKKGTIIDIKEMRHYADNKVIILCTGAQGEDNAVLMRIANKEHRSLKIEKGDTVVFSSSVIPGNERSVQRLKDQLYRLGADVIHYKMMDVHAGGHAKQEDLLDLINMVKPKYHIPIYGNHSFLRIHAKVALRAGIKPENIFVADNGQVIEFDLNRQGQLTKEKVMTDYVFVDGLGVGDVSNIVLRDRQMMAEDGMIVVIVTISGKNGKMVHSPDIISRGFIYMREQKELVETIRTKVKNIVNEHNKTNSQINETYIKETLRNDLGQYIFQKTERRPMILPVVIEV
jgi:ribonuclease J